jgi:RimJ/RimL family protein N-acetyltransferase
MDLELCGPRVRLRPHRTEDALAAYALLAGRDEILRWLVWDGPSGPAELANYYRNWCVTSADGPDLRLAVEERASGTLVGSLSLRFAGHPGQGDIGYWIGLSFQRRGLGRESLALAAALAFRHFGAHTLSAWVFVGNLASRRILEQNGFTLVRTVPGRIFKRGERVDEWHFVLLLSEWRRLCPEPRLEVESLAWQDEPWPDALDSPAGPFPSG